VDLEIERRAGDGPTVVLLHAGVADRRSWHGVAEHLGDLDVVAYDRRGFGESPPTDDEFTHLADLLAVLDHLGLGDPVWLVGNSMGGALALDAALASPERVAGLVLIGPAVSGAPEPADHEYDEETRRIGAAMERAEDDGDLETLNALEVRLWLDGPVAPEGRVTGAARDLALDMNRIALAGGMDGDAGQSGLDAWSRLGEITAPVTLAIGELDIPVANDRTRDLAARLPNARGLHVFEGAAHLPGLERPAEVAQVIRAAILG
jgi:pimeloyl-ACP methyl ester carboxylesterase